MQSKLDKIPHLISFLENEPDNAFLRYALAMEYVQKKEDDNALAQFELLQKAQNNYLPMYYHLAKLWERKQNPQQALAIYEQGISLAKAQNNTHALAELQNAYNLLLFDSEE
ncbi:MAG: hypothetical protein R2798_08190 [Chitinophagales bacterium]|nr:tetratricopeptide repeat protein [Bacteroidota bacterium]MCB9042414.1 tetratricopeptide repeat protein [Chitinophagales bacterium]